MRFFLPIMLFCSLTACKNERNKEESTDALILASDTTTTYPNDSAVSTKDSATIEPAAKNKTTEQQQTPKSLSKKSTEESVELSGVEIKNLIESESNEANTETESVEKGIRNPVSKPTAAIKKETPGLEKNNSADKMKTLFKK